MVKGSLDQALHRPDDQYFGLGRHYVNHVFNGRSKSSDELIEEMQRRNTGVGTSVGDRVGKPEVGYFGRSKR